MGPPCTCVGFRSFLSFFLVSVFLHSCFSPEPSSTWQPLNTSWHQGEWLKKAKSRVRPRKNMQSYSALTVGIGTPQQKFQLVADTGRKHDDQSSANQAILDFAMAITDPCNRRLCNGCWLVGACYMWLLLHKAMSRNSSAGTTSKQLIWREPQLERQPYDRQQAERSAGCEAGNI